MYCQRCGMRVTDTAKFCPECGARLNQRRKELISLTCQKCGGKLKAKDGEPMLYCPYCGEKSLIVESDRVTVQRIWSTTRQNVVKEKETTKREIPKTELEMLKEKNRHEMEMKKEKQKEDARDFKEGMILFIVAMLLFLILGAIGVMGAYN